VGRERRRETCRLGRVLVAHQQGGDAKIAQREGHRPAGAARAHQDGRLAGDRVASEFLLEAAAEADPVGVVARGRAVAVDGDGVDRADLPCVGRYRVEQRRHDLLERIGDVHRRQSPPSGPRPAGLRGRVPPARRHP